MRVRLTESLTRYDARLTGGQEGNATGRSNYGDRFTFVRFDCGAALDVLWKGLEITDEKTLAEMAARKKERDEQAIRAKHAVLHLGPRGGFQYLSFEGDYDGVPGSRTVGDRDEADRLMTLMREHGVVIREERK